MITLLRVPGAPDMPYTVLLEHRSRNRRDMAVHWNCTAWVTCTQLSLLPARHIFPKTKWILKTKWLASTSHPQPVPGTYTLSVCLLCQHGWRPYNFHVHKEATILTEAGPSSALVSCKLIWRRNNCRVFLLSLTGNFGRAIYIAASLQQNPDRGGSYEIGPMEAVSGICGSCLKIDLGRAICYFYYSQGHVP